MKKWIVLALVILVASTTILAGCNADKEPIEQEAQDTKEVSSLNHDDSMLPENVANILGMNHEELEKHKGAGEKIYMDKVLVEIKYDEKWFGWEEKVKTSYSIEEGEGEDKDKVVSIYLEFSKDTDDDKLIEQISKHLGTGKKHEGGENSNYYIEWEKDDFVYYLEDYGYFVMYIQKKQ